MSERTPPRPRPRRLVARAPAAGPLAAGPLVAACVAGALVAGEAHAAPLSLAEAMAEALEHNLDARAGALVEARADAVLLDARAAYDPALAVGFDVGSSVYPSNDVTDGASTVSSGRRGWSAAVSQLLPTGGTASLSWQEAASTSDSANAVLTEANSAGAVLSVRQPLLDGLGPVATNAPLRSARRDLDDARLGRRATDEAVAVAVSAAYWGLVAAREQAELARRSLAIAEQELADTQERLAEGFVGSGDVLQVERAAGVARQAAVVAEAEVGAAEGQLTALLGRPVEGRAPIEPTDHPVVPEGEAALDDALAQARAGNAAWLRERLAYEQAMDSVRQARWAALPDLGVTGSLGWSGLGANPGDARALVIDGAWRAWSVGVDLAVPLPGRAKAAALRRARLDAELAAVARDRAEQSLVLEVEAAVRNVARDRTREALARATVDAARAALDADRELLAEGRGATRDVIRSLEALDEAQVARLQAEIDLQASLLELARVEGRLLPLLGLE